MTTDPTAGRFGIDLITLYDPGFWSCEDREAFAGWATTHPAEFWGRVLDVLSELGVAGVELTFPPGDWRTAERAFGSAAGFAQALSARSIGVIGSFFTGLAPGEDAGETESGFAEALALADFLSSVGASHLVVGLPDSDPSAGPFDFARATRVADMLNRLGAQVASRGLRMVLHTEHGSDCCRERDIDLLMLLTDPALVGLCPDSAHIQLAGGDPVEVLRRHLPRVSLAHWKDVAGRFGDDPLRGAELHARHAELFRPVGKGEVDWAGWARGLARAPVPVWNILEVDGSANPVSDIRAAMAAANDALEVIA